MEEYQELKRVYRSLGWREPEEQCILKGKAIIEAVYQYIFNNSREALGTVELPAGEFKSNLKEQCMKLCGVIKDNR